MCVDTQTHCLIAFVKVVCFLIDLINLLRTDNLKGEMVVHTLK